MTNIREKARADLGPFTPYCEPSGKNAHRAMVPIIWNLANCGYDDEMATVNGDLVSLVGRWLIWQTEQGFIHANRYNSARKASSILERCADEQTEDEDEN
jgi:hypothetical protein